MIFGVGRRARRRADATAWCFAAGRLEPYVSATYTAYVANAKLLRGNVAPLQPALARDHHSEARRAGTLADCVSTSSFFDEVAPTAELWLTAPWRTRAFTVTRKRAEREGGRDGSSHQQAQATLRRRQPMIVAAFSSASPRDIVRIRQLLWRRFRASSQGAGAGPGAWCITGLSPIRDVIDYMAAWRSRARRPLRRLHWWPSGAALRCVAHHDHLVENSKTRLRESGLGGQFRPHACAHALPQPLPFSSKR